MATAVVDTKSSTQTATMAMNEALTKLVARYVVANAKSAQQFEERIGSGIPGGNNRASIFFKPFPLTYVKAEGATLTTADGKVLTDLLGNFTAGLFGHSPAPVRQAVEEVLKSGWSLGGHNQYEKKVAAEFTSRFPSCEQIKFCNTGTEASLYAMNTARAVTGRSKILMYQGGYHGGVIHGNDNPLDSPYEKILVPYSPDPAQIVATIQQHKNELAAVYIEPITLSPHTYLKELAPKKYLAAVRQACTDCDVCLIYDEVMTSRLSIGGAQKLLGVTPDMTTFGKYFAGGMPFGAFGGGTKWMERHSPLHEKTMASGGTFNQNTITMAAAAATFDQLWTPEICDAHNAKGDRLRERINEISKNHGSPVHAYGCGSLVNLVWQARPVFGPDEQLDVERSDCVNAAAGVFFFHMLEQGFLCGSPGRTFLTLSTALTDADYENFLSALDGFLKEYKPEFSLLVAETGPTRARL